MATIPVKDLYKYLEKMLDEQWGYIFGTAGTMWTEAKQKNLEAKYSADDPDRGMGVRYGSKWIGHMVTDCSGVLVYIGKKYGINYPHGSTSMIKQGYLTDWDTKPHPGWAALVDDTPETPDNKHIGYVGADGVTVYEAKGTVAGFITSKATDKKWTKFCKIKHVDYSNEEEVIPVPPVSETYYAEITGDNVRLRSGPGTNYKKIGDNLFKGEQVEVLATCDNWKFCRIVSDGRQGYVFGQYVSEPIVTEIDPDEVLVGEYLMISREDLIEIVNFAKNILEKFGPILEASSND